MVYCGKPSKGCLACRSRKTRCDRQTPACSQCVRAKRECPGYRNQLDLMFRNESDTVIGKATAPKPRNKSKSSSSSSNPTPRSTTPLHKAPARKTDISSPRRKTRAHEFFLDLFNHQTEVPDALSPSIESRALSFYRNREAIWLQNFDMVESICSPTNTEDYLLASLSAVGLASYAASVRSPKLMLRARRDYGHALSLTNQALKSPTKFTSDSTLFAVMALGVFEAVAGSGAESLDAWTNHLMGATALVKERGFWQLRTEAGQRMFHQINSNLMFYNITYGLEIPTHITDLRKLSEPFVDTLDCGWRISGQIIEFTNLRAKVMQGKLRDRREIVNRALELDDVYNDIAANRSPRWRGKIIRDNTSPDAIWNGVYVVYSEFWVAQMLNSMRIFRIHTLDILREQVQADVNHEVFSSEEAASLMQRAVTTMLEMQAQILASVPQYAPWGVTSYPSSSSIESWHAHQVLWPLYLSANLDFTTREVTEWALQRFRVMDREGGIAHAATFAEALEKRMKLRSDGAGEQGLANPLKMDPFDWKGEGWAIVHATILSAQINKPKTPPTSPKTTNLAAPPSAAPGGFPPPGWKGGPPPGWKGGPPPGWVPPPGFRMPPNTSDNSSGTASIPDSNGVPVSSAMAASVPQDFSKGPPSWWRPGMPMGPPSHITQNMSSTATGSDPRLSATSHGAPSLSHGMSIPNKTTTAMQQSLGPPKMDANGIPIGWTGPSPKGWSATGPPSHVAQNTAISPPLQPSKSGPPKMGPNGIPIGWTGPPPEGWVAKELPVHATQDTTSSPMSSGMGGNSNTSPVTRPPQFSMSGPPKFGANGIPIGWKGPPPKGWKVPGSS